MSDYQIIITKRPSCMYRVYIYPAHRDFNEDEKYNEEMSWCESVTSTYTLWGAKRWAKKCIKILTGEQRWNLSKDDL